MATLRNNVDRLLAARGISETELARRLKKSKRELTEWLVDPPKRKEGIIKQIATALVVPDFYLFAENLTPEKSIPDFRLAKPAPNGYQRATIRAIEFARQVQDDPAIKNEIKPSNSLASKLEEYKTPSKAAAAFRDIIKLSETDQIEFKDARLFYAHVRRKVEECETLVFQMHFPKEDGIGLALTSKTKFNSIVINTTSQIPARRLFTLAHEVYHCKLNLTGVSDPEIVRNNVEQQCNQFAAEFLAPESLVEKVAGQTIKSNTLDLEQLRNFSSLIKLSLTASLYRLVETGHYKQTAVAQWMSYLRTNANPDFSQKQGGRRVEEWKYKLSKYGTRFAEAYSAAFEQDRIDDYEFYRISGIKPKYQSDYLTNAPLAALSDAEDGADA
ncbi:ImmA/IrrE family metallo-endopeptidase [Bradyrhizobium betae]|uniref:ImmA/IrrE family metallo-endopeptidase n=1 Tax=Bradyrhizobium betae TaxID=244734 RepID=UPI003D666222